MDDLKKKKLGYDREILKITVGHPYITPQNLRCSRPKEDNPSQGKIQNPCGSRK